MQNLLINFTGIFSDLWGQMGMSQGGWQNYVMLLISFVLMFLAIVKKYEPMLLLPIAFGMFLINLPGAERILWGVNVTPDTSLSLGIFGEGKNQYENVGVYSNAAGELIYLKAGFLDSENMVTFYSSFENLQSGISATPISYAEFSTMYSLQGFIQGAVSEGGTTYVDQLVMLSSYESVTERGLLWYLYYGVDKVIYPPLIFLGIGAMTDFGPLIANPKSMFIGAGAQLGIFVALFGAVLLGFTGTEAAAIAIIGGADGPTAIYVSKMLAEHLVPTIAIAAYSYMALIPAIQKPVMRLLTTKKERAIRMKPLRQVSKAEKIIFPVAVTLVVGLLLPDAIPLLGMLMLGNLFRESGVVERLSSQAQNGLINTITIFLGISVGCKAKGGIFLTTQTLGILAIGIIAFYLGTIGGILVAKLMCKLTKGKINPLIGSAGVSAVPMAARISEDVGRETDPSNHLLMHAMGPNVAGVIGSALAAGVLLAIF